MHETLEASMIRDFRSTFRRVTVALRRRGRSEHEAEDLAQDAWIRLDAYQREHIVEKPEAFLLRTAINLSIDANRARKARGDEVDIDDVVVLDSAPSLDSALLAREQLRRLDCGLARLSARTREIFLAYRMEGKSYEAIGDDLGISGTAVAKHVAKATLQLTRWMDGW